MTKNIEDLLYRGDSLERMGEMSGRLREDSKKYRKAAVRINWELLIKQVCAYQFIRPHCGSWILTQLESTVLLRELASSLSFSSGGGSSSAVINVHNHTHQNAFQTTMQLLTMLYPLV